MPGLALGPTPTARIAGCSCDTLQVAGSPHRTSSRREAVLTVLLGIAGSVCAGLLGQFLGWYQAGEGAGFIASVIMAVILLVISGKVRGGSS